MQFNILFFIFQNLGPKSEKSPVSWPFFEIFQNFEKICSFGHKRVLKQMDFLGGPKKAYFLPTASYTSLVTKGGGVYAIFAIIDF